MAIYSRQVEKKPPVAQSNWMLWLKENLFSDISSILLTFFILYLLFLTIPPLSAWVLFDADFTSNSANDCRANSAGACWSYAYHKLNLFLYGFYPEDSYWRVYLSLALVFVIIAIVKFIKDVKTKRLVSLAAFIIYPIIAFFLLYGGFLSLSVVETDQWGGLLLTIVIASTGIIFAMPIGILLALGRQSSMPIIRYISIGYIEFIRGVPLITILFMASVVLPLFVASGTEIDKLLRALIGITLFQSAYVAEIIRGGLQAIPKGQYEASDALGLSYWKQISLIIMPQVLKVSIPNLTGTCISLFKDTTLVLIIGLFDMLAMVGLTSSDSSWLGLEIEGYVFVGAVFWIILYSASRYTKKLEAQLSTER